MSKFAVPKFAVSLFILLTLSMPGASSAQDAPPGNKSSSPVSPESNDAAETATLDPMVVTGTRVETPASQTTKSVSVVTAKDRDEQQQFYLPELIADEPGVFLNRAGGLGQLSNISIRGAGPQYTQYLYNGFPLRDAADTQSTLQYFIEDLYGGSSLKQIEILKGTQSTLYGSQAMGGVVNFIPDKWMQGMQGEIRSEFGEHGTFIENGRAYYGEDKFYIDVSPLYVRTDGAKNGGQYGYWYNNFGLNAGAGFRLSPNTTVEFSSIYADTDLALSKTTPSLNASGNLIKNTADPDAHREGLMAQYGLTLNQEVSGVWDFSVKGAYTETQRHYFWSSVSGNQSNYDGSTGYLETQHNLKITDWLTFTAGLDFEPANYDGQEPRNTAKGDYSPVFYRENWYSYDIFSQAHMKFLDESLFLNLGGRFTDHEVFDSKVVEEASVAYIFKDWGTKLHSQIGTGYRTPSLYEIYGGYLYNGNIVTIGNPNLKPEESVGYEFGIEQKVFTEKVKVGLTWFHTDFDNQIIYDGVNNKYMNANKGKTEGIEASAKIQPWKWMNFSLAYTHAEPEYCNNNNGKWTRREYLPQDKIAGTMTFFMPHDVTGSIKTTWNGERIVPLYDVNYNSVRWEEPASVTVDAALSWKVTKHYEVFMKLDNIFNEIYTESAYVMPGRTLSGGFKLTF